MYLIFYIPSYFPVFIDSFEIFFSFLTFHSPPVSEGYNLVKVSVSSFLLYLTWTLLPIWFSCLSSRESVSAHVHPWIRCFSYPLSYQQIIFHNSFDGVMYKEKKKNGGLRKYDTEWCISFNFDLYLYCGVHFRLRST